MRRTNVSRVKWRALRTDSLVYHPRGFPDNESKMSTSRKADVDHSANESKTAGAEPPGTRTQLRAAMAKPQTRRRRPIGELLTEAGSIDDSGLRRGLLAQGDEPDMQLGELLLRAGEINADELYRALGEQLGLTYVRLSQFDVEPEALMAIPAEMARAHRVLPLMFNASRLIIASADPTNNETAGALQTRAEKSIEMVLANPSELDDAIASHYAAANDQALARKAEQLLQQQDSQPRHGESSGQDTSVVRWVDDLFLNAIQRQASDIHLRSFGDRAEVRYRIDGSLVDAGVFHGALMPAVVAHIKVMANIDLAERKLPQDGAIRFSAAHGPVDMRISILPAVYGSYVVIRISDPRVGLRRLTDIGFLEHDQRRLTNLLDRSPGLVLVTGPSGSGKTTTLYAALQELNTAVYNIVTVEDPVEYRLNDIVQIQVQPSIGFGFVQALRPILRHDPDVILVGELRDTETAKIAVESALTGRIVLAALQTNSAAQAITRLIEIGIPPYLVNATLAGVLAQRLVRRNCEHCKVVEDLEESVRLAFGLGETEVFWRGSGCTECAGTGYRGRVAVYELLEMSPALRKLVAGGASCERLEARAVEEGMVRVTLQAVALARSGMISLSEVFRARLN